MYNYQIKRYFLFWIVFTFWLCGYVLWIDLTENIVTKFQEDYNLWLSDKYLEVPYDHLYSKDPFWDSMKLYEWMSVQAKISSVKYLEDALSSNGCSLSKEKQWSILYYFVPEFRWEIARDMKMEVGDYASRNYVFDAEVILNYCTEFYNCITNGSKWEWGDTKIITSGTPENIETNCKEFFVKNYREWQAEKKRVQNLQVSWLWNDKYLNATIDDSPYDVMKDVGTIWELSYLWVKQPITPVFYDLPVFSDSKNALLDGKNWGQGDEEELSFGGSVSLDPAKNSWILNPIKVEETYVKSDVAAVKPLSNFKWLDGERYYEDLIDWLWEFRLNDDKYARYWSLCEEVEEDENGEVDVELEVDEPKISEVNDSYVPDIADLSKDEYKEIMDYMVNAVNSYVSLPEDKKQEIEKKAKSVWTGKVWGTKEETEELAVEILDCYKSCVNLDIDGQLACMLKCACWEITSPIFNPDVNPGMWPIYMVRYCAVPSVNPRYFYEWNDGNDTWKIGKKTSNNGNSRKKCVKSRYWECVERSDEGWNWDSNSNSREAIWTSFNPGWITIVSTEKWVNEILWVTDKLAREWKLWIWTQQHNFLDSTAKMENFAKKISITMSVDKRNVSQKSWKPTDEYLERTLKTKDNSWLEVNHIANPLDNPATKNRYLIVAYENEVVWDISASVNADETRQSQWYLNVAPWFIVDQSENSNVARYASISVLFSEWFDEQWDFWAQKLDYLNELNSYAKALYAKKW